ncbi:MAG: aldehyde dehydrogenase family protein [Pseudomonadota bacterium]
MNEKLSVRNPRTGEMDYTLEATSPEEIARIAAELKSNQAGWNESGLAARIDVLRSFCGALDTHRGDIVQALSADTGRVAIAKQEVDGLQRSIDRWCKAAPSIVEERERRSEALPHIAIQQRHEPYPLVGAISPWNFPLLLSFIDVTPALLAGCAAMIKPSEVTPRFAEPVTAAIDDVAELSKVLRFVPGDGRTGAELIDHVDAVAFTGSVATGKKVAAAAATAFIPAFLELGGKDPAVILAGSDLERASTAILRASVAATGQACQSLERVYVNRAQHDGFVTLLADKARATPLSYPDANQGIVGPLIFARQAEIIESHLSDATEKGATIVTGGTVTERDGGLWIEPTVLTNVDHSMRVMTEETFGPIMPVMAFDDEAEAIRLANESEYGLSAAVFGQCEGDALRVAERLAAGGISVNDAGLTTMIFEEQKSAFNLSGMGPSRMGPSGLLRFFRHKALFLNRGDVFPIETMAEG